MRELSFLDDSDAVSINECDSAWANGDIKTWMLFTVREKPLIRKGFSTVS